MGTFAPTPTPHCVGESMGRSQAALGGGGLIAVVACRWMPLITTAALPARRVMSEPHAMGLTHQTRPLPVVSIAHRE